MPSFSTTNVFLLLFGLLYHMLLVLPIAIVCGQCVVRIAAKPRMPFAAVLLVKAVTAMALLRCFVSNGTAIVNLLLLGLGLWLGESFCPVALTGSIATGKSTVAHMLLEDPRSDWHLIDADSIGHEILLPPRVLRTPPPVAKDHHDTTTTATTTTTTSTNRGDKDISYTVRPSESIYDEICAAFDDDKANFLDPDSQLIIRRKLGSVIFANDDKRRTLNRITHPRIIHILMQRMGVALYTTPSMICCADIPLLFESGALRYLFCLVVVVATNADLQYSRLRQRNPDLSQQDCRNRIQSQYPVDRKIAGADMVIWNNGSLEELQQRVQQVKATVKRRLHGSLSVHVLVFLFGTLVLLFQNMGS